MRVLQLLGNTAFGGATRIVLDISIQLKQRGHEVCLLANDPETRKLFQNHGFEVYDIETMCRSIHPVKDWKSIRSLKVFVRKQQIDAVHSHTSKGGVYSRGLKVAAQQVPVIHTVHGYYYNSHSKLRSTIFSGVERLLLPYANCTTFVNSTDYQWASDRLRTDGTHRLIKIFNGVDEQRFTPVKHREKSTIQIGISARIVWEKGYGEFIELVQRMKQEPAHFHVIGTGPDEQAVRSQLKNAPVTFHGFVQDIRTVLEGLDINVLPTYREGLSISILEAMAMGIPTITTDIRGNTDLITNDKEGILVPVGDVEALVEATRKLSSSVCLRREMGASARKKLLKSFTKKKMLEQYVTIIEEVSKDGAQS